MVYSTNVDVDEDEKEKKRMANSVHGKGGQVWQQAGTWSVESQASRSKCSR